MYIGIGYDIHRFKKNRQLILGGVRIKHKKGLDGHSDADVITHAVMDALLGAAGLPDIGHFFPNTDPKYKNISSLLLLQKVIAELKKKKLKANNIDIMIIAEEPKIYPYIRKIKNNYSKILKLPTKRIGIKATTNEGLDFIGKKQGLACIAVASIK